MRLKKLRGSGGYIMAQISDQQQARGNLGGPDLFLAPVGRIDPEKISKHFCNTCEREFEGPPKISYESPNEEVAENLVLVEKGKYVCSTCNSTIAEYREFKKSDDGQGIGLAKPIQAEGVKTEQVHKAQTEHQTQESAPEPIVQEQHAQVDSTKKPADASVNSIEGMVVFDENARKLGTAKQVGVDSAQTVVMVIARDDGTEVSVPWSKVKTVGEVVLLGDAQTPQPPASEPGRCPDCGFSNKPDAKFCEECGSKI